MIPGVYDCLGAKLAEQAGFEVLATSGFGIAASTLGLPDYGFLTATEALYTVGRIAQSVNILGTGDWRLGTRKSNFYPNPQSPTPNPQ